MSFLKIFWCQWVFARLIDMLFFKVKEKIARAIFFSYDKRLRKEVFSGTLIAFSMIAPYPGFFVSLIPVRNCCHGIRPFPQHKVFPDPERRRIFSQWKAGKLCSGSGGCAFEEYGPMAALAADPPTK
jgi:hypothetical protein